MQYSCVICYWMQYSFVINDNVTHTGYNAVYRLVKQSDTVRYTMLSIVLSARHTSTPLQHALLSNKMCENLMLRKFR